MEDIREPGLAFSPEVNALFQTLDPSVCEYRENGVPFQISETIEDGRAEVTIIPEYPCFVIRCLAERSILPNPNASIFLQAAHEKSARPGRFDPENAERRPETYSEERRTEPPGPPRRQGGLTRRKQTASESSRNADRRQWKRRRNVDRKQSECGQETVPPRIRRGQT